MRSIIFYFLAVFVTIGLFVGEFSKVNSSFGLNADIIDLSHRMFTEDFNLCNYPDGLVDNLWVNLADVYSKHQIAFDHLENEELSDIYVGKPLNNPSQTTPEQALFFANLIHFCEDTAYDKKMIWAEVIGLPEGGSFRTQVITYQYLGLFYRSHNMWGKLLPVRQKLVQLKPLDSNAHKNLSSAYTALGNYREAIKVLESMHRLPERDDIEIQILIASNLYQINAYERALDIINSAEEMLLGQDHPDAAQLFLLKGLTLKALGQTQNAIEAFQKGLVINPKHYQSLINLTKVYLSQGKYDEAEKTLNELPPDKFTEQPVLCLLHNIKRNLGDQEGMNMINQKLQEYGFECAQTDD